MSATVGEMGSITKSSRKLREGEVWEQVDGVFYLRLCPSGFLLVNTTVDTSECLECDMGTYTIDPFLGCGPLRCDARACIECPDGATCGRGSSESYLHFLPKPLELGETILSKVTLIYPTKTIELMCDRKGCFPPSLIPKSDALIQVDDREASARRSQDPDLDHVWTYSSGEIKGVPGFLLTKCPGVLGVGWYR